MAKSDAKNLKIFLSYSRADRDVVQKVADRLRQAELTVWDPDYDLLAGSEWASEPQSALDSAKAMIVFISPDAMASREVSHEIEYALGAKHLRGRLIPVILRQTKEAPWILSSLQPIHYAGPNKTSSQIVELLNQPPNVPQTKRQTG